MAKATPHFNDLMRARGGAGMSAPQPGGAPKAPPKPPAAPKPPAMGRRGGTGAVRAPAPPPTGGFNGM